MQIIFCNFQVANINNFPLNFKKFNAFRSTKLFLANFKTVIKKNTFIVGTFLVILAHYARPNASNFSDLEMKVSLIVLVDKVF